LIFWLRKITAGWRLSPATAGGKPVASWVSLDATLDYTIASAKKKGERSILKNLRGPRDD